MEHLQHLHGFAKGDRVSKCPAARNDRDGDGIIDLIETEPVAGTTMVPFHDDPVSMEIVKDTYPAAGADGSYSYEFIREDGFPEGSEGCIRREIPRSAA
jgi:hypothetical protein